MIQLQILVKTSLLLLAYSGAAAVTFSTRKRLIVNLFRNLKLWSHRTIRLNSTQLNKQVEVNVAKKVALCRSEHVQRFTTERKMAVFCPAKLSWVECNIIGVWTAAHHRTCRTTASRSPVLTLGGICVPPTVNYLQCLITGSTLTAVGPFQLPAPQSGTLSRILSCLLYTSDAADE